MKITIIFLLGIFSSNLAGQFIKPEFIFRIVGEDTMGNKDTVYVGYHTESLSICDARVYLDPRFDNREVTDKKWNKPFEMRMINTKAHTEVEKAKSSKNTIVPYTYDLFTCPTEAFKQKSGLEYAQLYIKCKFPPFKLSWDSTLFINNSCAANSFIVSNAIPNYSIQFIDPGAFSNKVELKSEGILIDSAKVIIDLIYPDNTKDTLNAHLVIGFASAAAKFIVGTNEQQLTDGISIYPNPSNQRIYMDIGNDFKPYTDIDVKIVSVFGQCIFKKAYLLGNNVELDISDLMAGPYVAMISSGDKRFVGRFLKL